METPISAEDLQRGQQYWNNQEIIAKQASASSADSFFSWLMARVANFLFKAFMEDIVGFDLSSLFSSDGEDYG